MITKGKRYSLLGYPGPKGEDGNGAAIKAGTVIITGGTVDFQNSNSITFGLATNGVMTASFSQETVTGGEVIGLQQLRQVQIYRYLLELLIRFIMVSLLLLMCLVVKVVVWDLILLLLVDQ